MRPSESIDQKQTKAHDCSKVNDSDWILDKKKQLICSSSWIYRFFYYYFLLTFFINIFVSKAPFFAPTTFNRFLRRFPGSQNKQKTIKTTNKAEGNGEIVPKVNNLVPEDFHENLTSFATFFYKVFFLKLSLEACL